MFPKKWDRILAVCGLLGALGFIQSAHAADSFGEIARDARAISAGTTSAYRTPAQPGVPRLRSYTSPSVVVYPSGSRTPAILPGAPAPRGAHGAPGVIVYPAGVFPIPDRAPVFFRRRQ